LQVMSLKLQNIEIFANGRPVLFVRDELKALLKQSIVTVTIDLKSGPFSATAWGCDLSKKYVDINTEYS